ncbi:MAG: sialate O-acetylesterase, partial [Verrucomicrobiales bacterium]
IHPLLPFAARGVIWYQGESNRKNPEQYRTLFPALIRDWRAQWGRGDFPFYFVQIAPFRYNGDPVPVAFLREAQSMALAEPHTGMVVTMDVGDPTNIHPKDKKPVGERLARLALAKDYGREELVYSGPMYLEQEIERGQIRLKFSHVGRGLASRDGEALSHFTIAGEDRQFHSATAVIDGDEIVVRSEEVAHPVAVRFGWGNADEPNFMNQEGLPASSFRTDDWPIEAVK